MSKNPYMGPEMYAPNPEKNEQEGIDYLSVRPGERIHLGDRITVVRTNGDVEHDWVLRSFGAKSSVLEKLSTDDRKVVPVEEFIAWQIMHEGREGNRNSVPEVSNPNRALDETETKDNAAKIGIDITDPDWKNNYEKKIREITGA